MDEPVLTVGYIFLSIVYQYTLLQTTGKLVKRSTFLITTNKFTSKVANIRDQRASFLDCLRILHYDENCDKQTQMIPIRSPQVKKESFVSGLQFSTIFNGRLATTYLRRRPTFDGRNMNKMNHSVLKKYKKPTVEAPQQKSYKEDKSTRGGVEKETFQD